MRHYEFITERKKKKRSKKAKLSRYFFPGFAYYGGTSDSGDMGGGDGGGESKPPKALFNPKPMRKGEGDSPDDYEYTDKIFGFDYDGFLDSKLDEVDPQTSEEYEFDKIYKSFDEFKRDYPQEAKDLFAWHPKGGEFLFNRNKQGSDFDGIMVKFKPIK